MTRATEVVQEGPSKQSMVEKVTGEILSSLVMRIEEQIADDLQ